MALDISKFCFFNDFFVRILKTVSNRKKNYFHYWILRKNVL